ncbi:hypothetical protein ANN_19348 [Periplaneta americana]|uniref:Uncharacterized protein n=1 Tax=Periplaneta americana TaxID=6978 RepID=A0ABQ8S9Y8_PERAM|nr:hypothetical protein ANN_19348 [Periplaneta americana]
MSMNSTRKLQFRRTDIGHLKSYLCRDVRFELTTSVPRERAYRAGFMKHEGRRDEGKGKGPRDEGRVHAQLLHAE